MKRERDYEEIVDLFVRLVNKYKALEKIPVDYGVGRDLYHSERHLIDQIGDHPEKNITELAKYMGVTKGAISQTVKKLENKGVVRKYKGEGNEKEVLLKLTEIGADVFNKHQEVNREAILPFYAELERYSDDKVDFLLHIFKWLDDFLEESKAKMESHVKKKQ